MDHDTINAMLQYLRGATVALESHAPDTAFKLIQRAAETYIIDAISRPELGAEQLRAGEHIPAWIPLPIERGGAIARTLARVHLEDGTAPTPATIARACQNWILIGIATAARITDELNATLAKMAARREP